MFRSILVAVDGSPAATCALKEAVDIARSEGARLTLISVAKVRAGPWASGRSPRRSGPKPISSTPPGRCSRRPRASSRTTCRSRRSSDTARPPAAILNRVNAACHDLVVMGSRGLGPAGAFLLGSVSRAVVAQSPVPVLVTRAEQAEPLEPAFAT